MPKHPDPTLGRLEVLRVQLLTIVDEAQSRQRLDPHTVETYTQRYLDYPDDDDVFPPVMVYAHQGAFIVGDGIHRVTAARKAGRLSLPCRIVDGTVRDAWWAGVRNNTTHGLQYNNGDKRKIIESILDHPQESRWSDRDIARRTGISNVFVSRIRKERKIKAMEEVLTVNTLAESAPVTPEQRTRRRTRYLDRLRDTTTLLLMDDEAAGMRPVLESYVTAIRDAIARYEAACERLELDVAE